MSDIEFEDEPTATKSWGLGFRVSQDALDDLLRPAEPRSPEPWTKRMWREVKWRIGHAWDALVRGDCGYI